MYSVSDLPRRLVAILLATLLVGVQLLVFPGAAQGSSFPTPILDEPRVDGFEVTLEWTFDLDIVETPAQSTTVERQHPNGSMQSIKVDPPDATTFTDQLTDAGDYLYRIRATYRDDPHTIHRRSGGQEVTVPGHPPDPPPRNGDGPFAPPENLQASLEVRACSFGATVNLQWDAPAIDANVPGYVLTRDPTAFWSPLRLGGDETSFSDSSVWSPGTYGYALVAQYADGTSAPENVEVVVAAGPDEVTLAVVGEQVEVTWRPPSDPPAGASLVGYHVYRCEEGAVRLSAAPVAGTAASFALAPTESGYLSYAVTAVYARDGGPEQESLASSGYGFLVPPPLNLQASLEDDEVEVTWTSPEGVSGAILGYDVFRNGAALRQFTIDDASDDATATSYTDASPLPGINRYAVRTVVDGRQLEVASGLLTSRFVEVEIDVGGGPPPGEGPGGPEPEPEPVPPSTPVIPQPVPEPEPVPPSTPVVPQPTPEPQPEPTQEPTPDPTPEPEPEPAPPVIEFTPAEPEPLPEEPEPLPEPTPVDEQPEVLDEEPIEADPQPDPVPAPAPAPAPGPVVTPAPAPAPGPLLSAGTEAGGLPAQAAVEQQPAEVGEPQPPPEAEPALDEEVEVAGELDVAAEEPLAVGELAADVLSTLPGGTVVVTGDGCPSGAEVTASIDGVVVGSALAGADGRFEVEVVTPSIPGQFEVQIACGEVVRTVPIAVVLTTSTAGVGSSMVGTVMAFFLLLSVAAWPRRSVWEGELH